MDTSNLSTEQRVLIMMRKILAKVVRETTPPPGMRRTISDELVDDIRACLELISVRERELTEARGIVNTARPRYADEPKKAHVVKLHPSPKKSSPSADE